VGTVTFEPAPAPEGAEGLLDAIDQAAEIGLSNGAYRQALVDQARQGVDKTEAFAGLNAKWAAGRAAAG